jgi:CheY-like chemotaxis protein
VSQPETIMGAPDQESTNAHVVLLVDDEVSILSALRLVLEPKGFKVIVAANPFAAVKLAVSQEPDVIVMDLDMPGMDGMEAARHLKHIEQTRRIPVIAYTGRDWASSEYLRCGFEQVIQKSSGFDTLESHIAELLREPRPPSAH